MSSRRDRLLLRTRRRRPRHRLATAFLCFRGDYEEVNAIIRRCCGGGGVALFGKKYERSNASMVPLLSRKRLCGQARGLAWLLGVASYYVGGRCITFLCACRLALCSEHYEHLSFLTFRVSYFPCLPKIIQDPRRTHNSGGFTFTHVGLGGTVPSHLFSHSLPPSPYFRLTLTQHFCCSCLRFYVCCCTTDGCQT